MASRQSHLDFSAKLSGFESTWSDMTARARSAALDEMSDWMGQHFQVDDAWYTKFLVDA